MARLFGASGPDLTILIASLLPRRQNRIVPQRPSSTTIIHLRQHNKSTLAAAHGLSRVECVSRNVASTPPRRQRQAYASGHRQTEGRNASASPFSVRSDATRTDAGSSPNQFSRLSMCSDVRFWSRATLKTRLSKRVSCGAPDPVQPGCCTALGLARQAALLGSFAEALDRLHSVVNSRA